MVNSGFVRDNEARAILRTIHSAYVEVTANNPFYQFGQTMTTKQFREFADGLPAASSA